MKYITLESHYFHQTTRLRVTEETYAKLSGSDDPMKLISRDVDLFNYGYKPLLISVGQCRKIGNFFNTPKGDVDNYEYFDKVIF